MKYVYWMNPDAFHGVNALAAEEGISIHEAKKAVCVPLSKKVEMGVVHPHAWDYYDLCKRQLSWYHDSPFAGKTLLISARDLTKWGLKAETVISLSKFRCRKFPGREEQLSLLGRESYKTSKPDAWDRIDSEENQRNSRWLKIMGIHGKSYEELFVTHCANHANFIQPEYFVKDGQPIPYSLGKTTHICSACLEFFNIIGSQWKKKLVVPCPGAVLFAGMSANRYYEVVKP